MTFLNFLKNSLFLTLFYTTLGIYTPALAKNDTEEQKIEDFFKDLEIFTTVFSNIKKLYVDDVDNKKLFNYAIKGMVSGLDPHSAYLELKEQKSLLESALGKFGGLGIIISMKDEVIQVISPIDDTPAYKAGIQAGDLIVKINNKVVRGMTLEDSVELMRGKAGTNIQITIVRKNKKPFVVDIIREIITIISVKGYLLEKNIGYIRISSFQNPTAQLLKQIFNDLVKENNTQLSSLIIDLRNNPGGVLNSAVDVSNLFLDKKGLVVYTKGRIPISNLKFKIKSGDIMQGLPIVVLINEGSASASEIVAGALQDHKRAIIMGTTSFGKGSVQTILESQNGHGLKLTTARYYTPNGRSIQAKGIVPDIKLKNINLQNEIEKSIIETKEKNLDGHLEVENSSKEILSIQKQNKTKQNKTIIKKLEKDYFIHEAKNLLKALTIINNQK
ncbi:MAG: S41 family peptidase [Candidatus Vesicomyosocius endoextente]|uniref:S41 family peptidase n=1 Tax=Candidatus Vesicomyosocius endoextente TaxID=2738853 RepID=A0A853G7N4_9GAMM|nr:S41 family peptidase [Candidatus Vesicomyosocius endoextente]